jgi:hypothetical protein
MNIRNQKDFWAGIMFVAFGAGFAAYGTRYAFGTAERMGPGYFPGVLGLLLVAIGVTVAVRGVVGKGGAERIGKFAWSTLLLIIGPVVLFGLLLGSLGLVACLLMLVGVSSYASHEFGWKATLGNAVVLIGLSLLVFVYLLKLQFPLWPAVFGL